MMDFKANASTYMDDEYIEEFVIKTDDKKYLDCDSRSMTILRYSMEGTVARFDPVIGKNVVDHLKGDEIFPVEVLSVEKKENQMIIKCGKISTRVKFEIRTDQWTLKNADLTGIANEECERFTRHTYERNGVKLNYRLFTPQTEAGKKYPLVLTMHGSGETGDRCGFDNNLHISDNRLALSFATEEWQKSHPCYILSPQFPSLAESYDTAHYEDAYLDIIRQLEEDRYIDTQRIYGATLSMGSRIMYSLLTRYPDYFAGLIINAGNPGGKDLSCLKDLPIMITHIENDNAVMTEFGKNAFKELIKCGNRNVRMKLYPEESVGWYGLESTHQSWALAMNEKENREWLFAQKKGESDSQKKSPILKTERGCINGVIIEGEIYVPLAELAEKDDAGIFRIDHAEQCLVRYDFITRYLKKNVEVYFI